MSKNILDKIEGKYVYISKAYFPLKCLSMYFDKNELYSMFGEKSNTPYYLEEIESDCWSKHLFFTKKKNNAFSGYLRIIEIPQRKLLEIHGGGINKSFLDKIVLTEAWLLIIQKCFALYNYTTIKTSSVITNKKAYKLITGTGFKEINRCLIENRITYELTYNDFKNNCKIDFFNQ